MLLGFADELDLILINRRAVEDAYAPLKKETARIGLTIKSAKTKYTIAGRDRGRPIGVSTELVIDGAEMCLKLLKNSFIMAIGLFTDSETCLLRLYVQVRENLRNIAQG